MAIGFDGYAIGGVSVGEPEDVANLALRLASEESAFATGQLYVIDGGLTAHAPAFSFA